jgi:hypothetical protein
MNLLTDGLIATIELMKDGSQGDVFASRLVVVEVGMDVDGDKLTSCIIAPVEGLAPRKEKPQKLPNGARRALEALHDVIGEFGGIPSPSPRIAPATRTVTIEQWRARAYKLGISTSDEPRAMQQAFKRAFEHLVAEHRVGVWDGHVWPA